MPLATTTIYPPLRRLALARTLRTVAGAGRRLYVRGTPALDVLRIFMSPAFGLVTARKPNVGLSVRHRSP